MLRIDALKQQLDELSRYEGEYWGSLRAAVQSLRTGFSNFLASDARGVHEQARPKVSVGTLAADSSISGDLDNLPRVNRQLHFTLVLDLTDERSYYPESFLAFNLSVERNSVGKIFVVDLDSNKVISTPSAFTSVYEHLYARCREKLRGPSA